MNEIKIFKNEDFGEVRTVEIDNEPWFIGKDVADVLGYQNGSRDVNRHVDEEDRQKIMAFDGSQDRDYHLSEGHRLDPKTAGKGNPGR